MTPELWKRLIHFGKLAGIIGVISGAVVSADAAWPLVEPYLAAHRGYVRFVASDVTDRTAAAQSESRRVIRDLQIEQAEGKRDSADTEIVKLTIELAKPHDDTVKQILSDQIQKLMNTRHKLNSQIETLNKVRGQ